MNEDEAEQIMLPAELAALEAEREASAAPVPTDDHASSHGGEHGGSDLRARLEEMLNTTLVTPEGETERSDSKFDRHDRHNFLYNCAVCQGNVPAIVSAVVAELVSLCDPGDLPQRMAAAIDQTWTFEEDFDAAKAAAAAMSVRWEDAVQARARAEAAEAEVGVQRDRASRAEAEGQALIRERNAAEARADRAAADLDAAIGDHAEERTALEERVATLEGERDGLHETIAAADADRDRLEAQVAALQRELAEAKAEFEAEEKLISDLRDELDGLAAESQAQHAAAEEDIRRARGQRDEARRELTEAKQAVYTAQITHIRDTHPDHPHVADCLGCRVLVPLSAAMPARPDDPEEIRRLAQATTESTEE